MTILCFAASTTALNWVADKETKEYIAVHKLSTDSVIKRIFDIAVSIIAVVCILIWAVPLFGVIIKVTSPGPIFFWQRRTGRQGKPFNMLKFRTMRHNLYSEFKQTNIKDSRITKFGKILRRTNLDELPQFINVLLGDMSIVGPRPHDIQHDAMYWQVHNYQLRYVIRPGITGLAQVRERRKDNTINWMSHRLRYDLFYVKKESFWFDLKIIKDTISQHIFMHSDWDHSKRSNATAAIQSVSTIKQKHSFTAENISRIPHFEELWQSNGKRVFYEQYDFLEWLTTPNEVLNDRVPIDYLKEPADLEKIKQLLIRLEYGVMS